MTNKGSFFSYSILALFLGSIILRNGDMLWISLPLILYLLVGAILIPSEIKVRAKRELSSSFTETGGEIKVLIEVENLGDSDLMVQLNDPIFKSIKKVESSNMDQFTIQPRQSHKFVFSFLADRGIYQWSSIELIVKDPLGVFQTNIEIEDETELIVSPPSRKTRQSMVKKINTFPSPGLILSGKTGPGTDFYSIAQYASGDSLKNLNWRLSNRIPNQMVINQFEKEEIGKYCLLVNAGIMSSSIKTEKMIFENVLEVVSGISTELIRNGNRVSFISYGDDLSIIHSGAGRNHLRRIKKRLAGLKQGNRIQLRNFNYFPLRLFPARSTILVFSQLNSRDLPVYQALIARNYKVRIFVPDSIQAEFFEHKNETVRSLALRLARIERKLLVNEFHEGGVSVRFIQPANPESQGTLGKTGNDLIWKRTTE